jgi:ribosomal protein S18 acetylase RimI-like enzyme
MEGSMTAHHVKEATQHDECRITDTIVLAFGADPAARWLYPEPQRYLQHFPAFVRAFGGQAFACRTAQFTDDARGASLWLPPGVHPNDEALIELIRGTVPESEQESLLAVFDEIGNYHPDEPHWYLPMIGVDPTQQRKGHGSALLEHALRICDQDGIPAYLESSNPSNIPLYRRHGFEMLGTIQIGTSPPITPMVRQRSSSSSRRPGDGACLGRFQ